MKERLRGKEIAPSHDWPLDGAGNVANSDSLQTTGMLRIAKKLIAPKIYDHGFK